MCGTHLTCNRYGGTPSIHVYVCTSMLTLIYILGVPPDLLQDKCVDGSGTKTWAKWTNKRLDTYALEAV